jgi:hypothetical protein
MPIVAFYCLLLFLAAGYFVVMLSSFLVVNDYFLLGN